MRDTTRTTRDLDTSCHHYHETGSTMRTMNYDHYRRALDALDVRAELVRMGRKLGTLNYAQAAETDRAIVRMRSAVERGYYYPSELGTESAPWSRVLGALACADRLGITSEPEPSVDSDYYVTNSRDYAPITGADSVGGSLA